MEKINSFKDLNVWKKSHEVALDIYKITKYFPPEEKFGLVSQMRRAAVSVAANIAEGFRRRTKKDKINFYNISQGSLSELEYYIILAEDLGYKFDSSKVSQDITIIGKMLNSLITIIAE